MVKLTLLLITAGVVVPGYSLNYDIQNVYNRRDSSTLSSFLSQLLKESSINKTQKYLSNRGSSFDGRISNEKMNWNDFKTWEKIKEWMLSLISKYPDYVTAQYGGTTFEKRTILGIKISAYDGKSGVLIEAGMHADEWIAPAAATYIIDQLINSKDEAITNLTDKFDWYIFPLVNPDGYTYARNQKYRHFWRKSISHTDGATCLGADLNRNWDIHWGEIIEPDTSITNTCYQSYPGRHAFSEIETKSFSEYLMKMKNKIQLYISLHSFHQLILYPYGYSSDPPHNIDDYKQILEAGKKGFASRFKTVYRGGSAYNELFPFSGSSMDWVYDNGIAQVAFSIKLRAPVNVENGYHINPKEILPICQETMDGIVSMVNEAEVLNYL